MNNFSHLLPSPFPNGLSSLVGALKFLGWTFTEGRSRRWATSGLDFNEMTGQSRRCGNDDDRTARVDDGEDAEADNNGDKGEGESGGDTHGPSILSNTKVGNFLKGQLHQMVRE